MSKWSRPPEAIARDLCIAFAHPRFRDRDALDVLRELKERRRGSV